MQEKRTSVGPRMVSPVLGRTEILLTKMEKTRVGGAGWDKMKYKTKSSVGGIISLKHLLELTRQC